MRSAASLSGRLPTPLPANGDDASTARRLHALHRMSGALSHDFNNLLGVILSANERLAEELPEGGEAQKLARIALEAAERGAELMRRSLALAQAPEPEPAGVDCAGVLDSLEGLARQALPAGVRLKICELAHALRCAGERVGVEMALLNLCINAGQASPDGGSVFVRVRELALAGAEAQRLGVAPGAYAVFTVRDTGMGMSPQVLACATEPLFTTKAAGTGLGLSSVVDLAVAAGGAFTLRSRQGHGATATLYLPVVPA